MSEKKHTEIDKIKILKAIEAEIPLLITTYTLLHDMEVYMQDVLSFFLKELNHEYMTEFLTYCLSELTTNAKKANTKRVYFAEKKLDINHEADYKKGMRTFKRETMDNINHYLALQKAAGLYVKFLLQVKNGQIKIEIRNNVQLTVFEYKRIHDKLTRAQQYSSVEDAFTQILDDTEGAGLGLVIMILMLRKIGLSDDNFCYLSENGETICRIVLPLNAETQENINTISKDIVKSLDELPHIPENIESINNMLSNPNVKLSDIAETISNDVALTADLLKMVNSATFSLRQPCQTIPKAVSLVGTRGIKNMLYSIASIQNLGNDTADLKALWQHCYQVAYYSYNIAKNYYPSDKEMLDDVYVCGLLHDMGKVLFENALPESIKKFENICLANNIPVETLEKLYAGINHSEIGALIADKWHFPEGIIEVIRYHHRPEHADKKYRKLCNVVYFANMIAQYQTEIVEYYQFDADVLNEFRIVNETQLIEISEKLKEAFNSRISDKS